MDNLIENILIGEKDTATKPHFSFYFIAESGVDFQEKWAEELIAQVFNGYNFYYSVILNQITILAGNCIFFEFERIDSSISPQEIANDIHDRLHECCEYLVSWKLQRDLKRNKILPKVNM
jgi:hypothetical protein